MNQELENGKKQDAIANGSRTNDQLALEQNLVPSTVTRLLPIGPVMEAHTSGAVLLRASATLVIADVHLGFSWAQRRRGELGPLADTKTRNKLLQVVEELRPSRIVFLGDLVHAPRPGAVERSWIEELLLSLSRDAEVIVVRGNHDRGFARDFHLPIRLVEAWEEGPLVALHGDRLPAQPPPEKILLTGHFHPALTIRDAAGAGQKVGVFLVAPDCIVLPAFSPFAGGCDIADGLPPQLMALLSRRAVDVIAASNTRVVKLGPLSRSVERALTGYRSNRV